MTLFFPQVAPFGLLTMDALMMWISFRRLSLSLVEEAAGNFHFEMLPMHTNV